MLSKSLSKFVDAGKPDNIPKIRDLYRNVRNRIYGPVWVRHPTNVQIDIHNYCNLWMNGKGCIHCNVKPSGGWNLPRGWMPTGLIEYIIRYWSTRGVKSIAPYINTEPLMDKRLKWICDLTQECGMHVELDTNGTLYDNRNMLVHPAMKQVRITFSAMNSETYKIVHGADLYRDALATTEWFLKHKLPEQYPMLYFITDKYNIDELIPFIKKWRGKAHLTLFPLHEVDNIQTESVKTLPNDRGYWSKLTKRITGDYPKQPNRCIDIYPSGYAKVRLFDDYTCCQGSHSFSVAWTGELLHCTDIPYSYNYGHIQNRDMLRVWHERNVAKLFHPACKVCNVKSPKHDEILRKWLKI